MPPTCRLHLRFALEVRELGKPMVLAVNMMDAASRRGIEVDLGALERELGDPGRSDRWPYAAMERASSLPGWMRSPVRCTSRVRTLATAQC
jgi:hypothetical protein